MASAIRREWVRGPGGEYAAILHRSRVRNGRGSGLPVDEGRFGHAGGVAGFDSGPGAAEANLIGFSGSPVARCSRRTGGLVPEAEDGGAFAGIREVGGGETGEGKRFRRRVRFEEQRKARAMPARSRQRNSVRNRSRRAAAGSSASAKFVVQANGSVCASIWALGRPVEFHHTL